MAMSIFRPTQKADRSRVQAGAAVSSNMKAAASRSTGPVPNCRPLNAAEMNEVERLSSMRAALYPND